MLTKMAHSSGIDDIGIAGKGNVNTFLSREWQTPLVSPVLKFYTNNKYVVLQNIDILEYV